MQQTMYAGLANSPQTELAAAIDDIQTTIPLVDASRLPDAPNIATIGSDETAETILYTGVSGNDLTGVMRGFEGVAKSWSAGSKVARNFTAYDHNSFKHNIEDHEGRIVAHLAEDVSDGVHGMGAAAAEDYEEGTFTPTVFGSTIAGTPTYVAQIGKYIKIGNKVTCHGRVLISAKGGLTGTFRIGGLPFASASFTGLYTGSIGQYRGVTVSQKQIIIENVPGQSYLQMYECGSGNESQIMDTSIADTTRITFTIEYFV